MRAIQLVLLCFVAYVVSMVFLFPAAPVVERIKPNIQPVQLNGVSGKLFSGQVANVVYADDLLPVQLDNVAWKLAPGTLLKGGAGVDISYEGYGGRGDGQVRRQWNGNINVSDFVFSALAKEFEPLLPAPVASFNGNINGELASLVVENELLSAVEGKLTWNDAVIQTSLYGPPLNANLGKLDVNISPDGDAAHLIALNASGGELALDGTINLTLAGDFQSNLVFTPSSNAPAALTSVLQRFAKPDAGGRYRVKQSGNINQGF